MEQQVKKKILFINSASFGSTGNICKNLYDLAERHDFECYFAYGRGKSIPGYRMFKIGNQVDVYTSVMITRLTDKHGKCNVISTKKFIKQIKKINPDIIHLHNIHGYFINYKLLFDYLKTCNKKIVWTLHDCWPYTGHCAHYLYNDCYKWRTYCDKCEFHNTYPKSIIDNAYNNFESKKESFLSIQKQNMILVSVSDWLKKQIQNSFLSKYQCNTITNGLDINVFNYVKSNFKSKNGLENKHLILGVANVWNFTKGLEDFIELSKRLDSEYQIVLVGLSKEQIDKLPKNILGIKRTKSARELACWYSSADIYVNFSKEETFSMTNFEAQACGTTVISYNSGGTPESLINKNAHLVQNIDEVINFITTYDYNKEKENVDLSKFDSRNTFEKYISLYERLL